MHILIDIPLNTLFSSIRTRKVNNVIREYPTKDLAIFEGLDSSVAPDSSNCLVEIPCLAPDKGKASTTSAYIQPYQCQAFVCRDTI